MRILWERMGGDRLKKKYCILIVLCLVIGMEVIWLGKYDKKVYPDIASQLDSVEINNVDGHI